VGCRHHVVVAGYCSVVPVSMVGLLYRIVFVFWKHGDASLIYCRVNLVVPFARELKHLTVCRPARRFIVSCLTALIFSSAGIDGNQNGIYTTTRYRYASHNDLSVNDGTHIRRWSRKIIIS